MLLNRRRANINVDFPDPDPIFLYLIHRDQMFGIVSNKDDIELNCQPVMRQKINKNRDIIRSDFDISLLCHN